MTRSEARARAHEAAVRSGDRAYVYRNHRGGLEEVRVWPSGETTYTKVDARGAALHGPRKALTRVGGLRANLRRPSSTGVLALGVLSLVVERLL